MDDDVNPCMFDDDALCYAKRFRNRKLAGLNILRSKSTDPNELSVYAWVAKWIGEDCHELSGDTVSAYDRMDVKYRQCLVTSVMDVSVDENDLINAIVIMGPLVGRNFDELSEILAFVTEYQGMTMYKSWLLPRVVARMSARVASGDERSNRTDNYVTNKVTLDDAD